MSTNVGTGDKGITSLLSGERVPKTHVRVEAVQRPEQSTEQLERELPPLQGFILPGGSAAASWAHVARSVCRRAERRTAAVPSPEPLPFLNRLSTYLYALARWCNHRQGVPETVWKP